MDEKEVLLSALKATSQNIAEEFSHLKEGGSGGGSEGEGGSEGGEGGSEGGEEGEGGPRVIEKVKALYFNFRFSVCVCVSVISCSLGRGSYNQVGGMSAPVGSPEETTQGD